MEIGSNQSQPPWGEDVSLPRLPRLTGDLTTDVCVVGAGIAGMTTAYHLSREGINVIVLDRGEIGSGETGRTTAHLTHAMDDRFFNLEKMHGPEKTRLIAESHTAAIDRIQKISEEEGIDCDFSRLDGYLFLPRGESDDVLERELNAAHRAGLRAVRLVSRAPLGNFDTGRSLLFPSQGQFHPLKYLAGLHRAIMLRGGRIFGGAHVVEVEGGHEAIVKTADNKTIRAGSVVVATNAPIVSRIAIASRQAGYRTYAVAARISGVSVHPALYWDTGHPYHYVRTHTNRGENLLIVGGEDHKTGQNDDSKMRWHRLEQWTRARFDGLGSFQYRWSGQVMEPVDGLGFIGRNPLDKPNVFIATGDSGQGITHGTIAGMLLTDLILRRPNPWAYLYDPSRVTVHAVGRFAQENLNAAAQYGTWVTAGDVESEDQIARDSGAVVRRGLKKIAVYRDPTGVLHERSAVCPHLGCHVNWNGGEKTWDCPCHGSRFDSYGEVIIGPAIQGLSEVDELPEKKLA